MKDIEAACHAIWAGAQLYAASDVPFFATKQGRTIGYSYAIVGAIRRLTKARVIVTGKPSIHAARFIARQLGMPIRDIGVVGDDPLVEIVMARRAGARSFGVTTGVTGLEAWQGQPERQRPDRVLADLRELLDYVTAPGGERFDVRRGLPLFEKLSGRLTTLGAPASRSPKRLVTPGRSQVALTSGQYPGGIGIPSRLSGRLTTFGARMVPAVCSLAADGLAHMQRPRFELLVHGLSMRCSSRAPSIARPA